MEPDPVIFYSVLSQAKCTRVLNIRFLWPMKMLYSGYYAFSRRKVGGCVQIITLCPDEVAPKNE